MDDGEVEVRWEGSGREIGLPCGEGVREWLAASGSRRMSANRSDATLADFPRIRPAARNCARRLGDLVFGVRNPNASSLDLTQDRPSRCQPLEGCRVLVAFPLGRVDAVDETPRAMAATALDRLLADPSEPALDLVEPGRVGRRAVPVMARALCRASTTTPSGEEAVSTRGACPASVSVTAPGWIKHTLRTRSATRRGCPFAGDS